MRGWKSVEGWASSRLWCAVYFSSTVLFHFERFSKTGGDFAEFKILGGDNNLLVAVGEFDPFLWSDNVRCFGSIADSGVFKSCDLMADEMEATETPKTWGPSGQPHDYLVPETRVACKSS